MPIPKLIHQVWLDKLTETNDGPPAGRYGSKPDSFKSLNPEFTYQCWNLQQVRQLFKDVPELSKFETWFNSVYYWIQKCDIARLLIVYARGGIYSDLDITCLRNLSNMIQDKEMVLTHDVLDFTMLPPDTKLFSRNQKRTVWNGFFAAAPKHPILLQLLEYFYNTYVPKKSVMTTTGPGAWGLASIRFGWDVAKRPDLYIDNCFILDVTCSQCKAQTAIEPFVNRSVSGHTSTWTMSAIGEMMAYEIETGWVWLIIISALVLVIFIIALVCGVRHGTRSEPDRKSSRAQLQTASPK